MSRCCLFAVCSILFFSDRTPSPGLIIPSQADERFAYLIACPSLVVGWLVGRLIVVVHVVVLLLLVYCLLFVVFATLDQVTDALHPMIKKKRLPCAFFVFVGLFLMLIIRVVFGCCF